jgi:hypothetical protein
VFDSSSLIVDNAYKPTEMLLPGAWDGTAVGPQLGIDYHAYPVQLELTAASSVPPSSPPTSPPPPCSTPATCAERYTLTSRALVSGRESADEQKTREPSPRTLNAVDNLLGIAGDLAAKYMATVSRSCSVVLTPRAGASIQSRFADRLSLAAT